MQQSARMFLCLALAAVCLPAGASTFLFVPQEDLVEQAESVVQGRVIDVQSFWNRPGTAIMTEATVEVEDVVLGKVPSHVRLITFGGEVGGYRIDAHGFPTFAKGERILVFLEPARKGEDGAHRVLGYRQGQFRIRTNKDGQEIAVPMWEGERGARVLKADGTAAEAPRPMGLLVLKRQIRETAERLGRPEGKKP